MIPTQKKMSLNDKVKALLILKDLQPSKFADMLEIPRSSISHILSGRNKPSLDIIRRVLEIFPEVNPDWLLFDDENMFRESTEEKELVQENISANESEAQILASLFGRKIVTQNKNLKKEQGNKKVEKIIIFYDDKSFDLYELE